MELDELTENINQFTITSNSNFYAICNTKIIVNEHLQILDMILKNISDNLLFYDYQFTQQVKEKFVEYYSDNETKEPLLNYPIQFMHLSFYQIYLNSFYNPLCLHYFNKYFINYQKFSEYKYNFVIIQLFDKLKNYNSIKNISNQLENLLKIS